MEKRPSYFVKKTLPPKTYLSGSKYCIEKPIGQGGFAFTHKARHTGLKNFCAIKEYFPEVSSRTSDCQVHPPQQVSSGLSKKKKFGKETMYRVSLGMFATDQGALKRQRELAHRYAIDAKPLKVEVHSIFQSLISNVKVGSR